MASVCLEQLPCWKRLQNTSIPTVLVDSGADGMFMDGIEGNPDNCKNFGMLNFGICIFDQTNEINLVIPPISLSKR